MSAPAPVTQIVGLIVRRHSSRFCAVHGEKTPCCLVCLMKGLKMERKGFMTLLKSLFILLLVACLAVICLFVSAGSYKYWNMFVCIAEFYLLESGLAIYLYRKDPDLLAKRMNAKEKHREQKYFTSIAYVVIMFSVLVLPGIDYRYTWSKMPDCGYQYYLQE